MNQSLHEDMQTINFGDHLIIIYIYTELYPFHIYVIYIAAFLLFDIFVVLLHGLVKIKIIIIYQSCSYFSIT